MRRLGYCLDGCGAEQGLKILTKDSTSNFSFHGRGFKNTFSGFGGLMIEYARSWEKLMSLEGALFLPKISVIYVVTILGKFAKT